MKSVHFLAMILFGILSQIFIQCAKSPQTQRRQNIGSVEKIKIKNDSHNLDQTKDQTENSNEMRDQGRMQEYEIESQDKVEEDLHSPNTVTHSASEINSKGEEEISDQSFGVIQTKQNWMEQLFGKRSDIKLSEVAIPGTHNSGTYSISPSSSAAPGESSMYDEIGIRDITASWARCQTNNLTQQLKDGIRYLDLRIAFNGDDQAIIVHGLESITLKNALDEINVFVKSNPLEIVLVAYKLSDKYEATISSEQKRDKISAIDQAITKVFHTRAVISGDINFTFADLWQRNQSVVIIKRQIVKWFDKRTQDDLFNAAQDYLNRSTDGTLFGIDLILTPTSDDILRNLTGNKIVDGIIGGVKDVGETVVETGKDVIDSVSGFFLTGGEYNRLYNWEKETLQASNEWLKTWNLNGRRINIVTTDFYDKTGFVDTILDINKTRFSNH